MFYSFLHTMDFEMEKRKVNQIAGIPIVKIDNEYFVVLITSRETKRWIVPKGWTMKGEKNINAARIEAFEEAGLKTYSKYKKLGRYSYEKRLKDGKLQPVEVELYLIFVKKVLKNWPEKKERDRHIISLKEASEIISDAKLKDIFLSLEAKLV